MNRFKDAFAMFLALFVVGFLFYGCSQIYDVIKEDSDQHNIKHSKACIEHKSYNGMCLRSDQTLVNESGVFVCRCKDKK